MDIMYGLDEEIYTLDADTHVAYGIVAYSDFKKLLLNSCSLKQHPWRLSSATLIATRLISDRIAFAIC